MWKAIKGYEDYYEVSDDGQIRSVDRIVPDTLGRYRKLTGKIMKQSESKHKDRDDGYLVVNLRKLHTSNVRPVHRLVAEAFLPNDDGLPTINHKDGNKHNNNVDNLEWASYSDNNIHALNNHLRNPRGKMICQQTNDGKVIGVFKSACEAARETGCSRGGIAHCLNGRTQTSGGYKWVFLSESQTTIPKGSTREDELLVEAQRPSYDMREDIVCAVSNNEE